MAVWPIFDEPSAYSWVHVFSPKSATHAQLMYLFCTRTFS